MADASAPSPGAAGSETSAVASAIARLTAEPAAADTGPAGPASQSSTDTAPAAEAAKLEADARTPLQDAIANLASDPDDPDAPLPPDTRQKTRERFEKLRSRSREAQDQLKAWEPYAPVRDLVKDWEGGDKAFVELATDLAEARKKGLSPDDLRYLTNVAHLLVEDPKGKGYEILREYLAEHEKAHGLVPAAPAAQPAAPASPPAGKLPSDLQDLVEAQYVSAEEAALIAERRTGKAPAPAAPAKPDATPPPKQDSTTRETTQLVSSYLAAEGVTPTEMPRYFNEKLVPAALALVAEDGLDPDQLTPKQQLRYVKLAHASLRREAPPAPPAPAAAKPTQRSTIPGGGRPLPRPAPGTGGERVSAAISFLAGDE